MILALDEKQYEEDLRKAYNYGYLDKTLRIEPPIQNTINLIRHDSKAASCAINQPDTSMHEMD